MGMVQGGEYLGLTIETRDTTGVRGKALRQDLGVRVRRGRGGSGFRNQVRATATTATNTTAPIASDGLMPLCFPVS